MKKIIIGIFIILCTLIVILIAYRISTMNKLERLNYLELADINPKDEVFRWTVSYDGGAVRYTSENMSWYNMTIDGYIVKGEFNMNKKFWKPILKRNDIYLEYPHMFRITWEALY